MENQYNSAVYRQNAAMAETLLLREISKRQLRGYKFRRQIGCEPMSVEFVCCELKLVIQLYCEHFNDSGGGRQGEYYAGVTAKGYHVARICHSEVLTNLIGVIDSLAVVIRQCKQALQMSRLANHYLSGEVNNGMGS